MSDFHLTNAGRHNCGISSVGTRLLNVLSVHHDVTCEMTLLSRYTGRKFSQLTVRADLLKELVHPYSIDENKLKDSLQFNPIIEIDDTMPILGADLTDGMFHIIQTSLVHEMFLEIDKYHHLIEASSDRGDKHLMPWQPCSGPCPSRRSLMCTMYTAMGMFPLRICEN